MGQCWYYYYTILAALQAFTVRDKTFTHAWSPASTTIHQHYRDVLLHHHHHLPEYKASITKTTALYSTSSTSSTPSIAPKPKQLKKKNLRTFARHLEVECWKQPKVRDLERVFLAVSDACRQISRIVARAQTDDLYGVATNADGSQLDENVQGEVQQKLDVVCNEIMLRALCGCSSSIAAVASEEEDEPRTCCDIMGDSAFSVGEYVAVFDPIDGSKNIDSSLPVGTIVGIYKAEDGAAQASLDSFKQNGNNMVAAAYCLYSATTVLVVTLGSGVDGFTLDPDRGVFLQTHPDIRIPDKGPIYSFNEANFHEFTEPVQRYLDSTKAGNGVIGKGCNARYVGALVADVHNILTNGGVYGYPGTISNPNGKLRLLYEGCPMAMIMEQAGGAGSTGTQRILDVNPDEIHQRVPMFLGSSENVYEVDQFHRYYGDAEEN
mmetsp:Transcript_18218/g.28373  ORF Transcript_18218/g.28373 Transcript_18218/m.28373 type:complete len:435 (-) Transcript_18218:1788-3092(-)|eukprot:CAMPEP_0196802646 /NCGR_PEP_ID=MMETSP1362-20130617/2220_1 /TAXON_ID=163516 /ORGANISM="Leptocylindrus danicus, Strain CCMP1856" /LENGTH=434 /DNA_ID=CAMNT_0042173991 /DNA_START=94 /DNA_END=1398 /DNA_ORIENTATION=+